MWWLLSLLLAQVVAHQCDTVAPSGLELRDDGGLAGWTLEQLRGRRWSATVVPSTGGEELFDGYSAGRCVAGTWTKEEVMVPGSDVSLCLAKCQQDEGCLGVLYGEVEGRRGPRGARCFLAGVGRNDVLMEYPGAAGTVVSFDALLELAASLQCWQKQRQRCVAMAAPSAPAPKRDTEPTSGETEHSVAHLLSELRSRLKSLPPLTSAARSVFRSVQPGHVLLILGGFCRLLGRAADNADLAVQRCLRAAQSTLEGPQGTMALCIVVFALAGLLGQWLRSWQQELSQRQAAKASGKVHYSDLVIPGEHPVSSSHQSVPMLLSSGIMPDTPTPKAEAPPQQGFGVRVTKRHVSLHRRQLTARVMTPPRPRRLHLEVEDDSEISAKDEVSPRRLSNAWKTAELRGGRASLETAPAREVGLLQLLNHPDFEVLRGVPHISDKAAHQIMSFRRRQGDLKSVSELHSQVGLKDSLVKKVLKEYQML